MIALPHGLAKARFSMLLNFPSYMKNNISKNEYSLLEELRATQFYKPKGRPPLSADAIHYVLHPRYAPFKSWHGNMNMGAFHSKQKIILGKDAVSEFKTGQRYK